MGRSTGVKYLPYNVKMSSLLMYNYIPHPPGINNDHKISYTTQ